MPISLEEGHSTVKLLTNDKMRTDDTGLIHGGFIFSLADYAAMLAVNHPNVVLGSSEVKFIKPAVSGQELIAEGRITEKEGKKFIVHVDVKYEDSIIFQGTFICYTPEEHVLKRIKT